MGERVQFAGGNGNGYLATPGHGSAGPGLLVIQEWWGLVPHIIDVCDRFADEGFTALAPDLYRGQTTTEPDEAAKLMMALNLAQAARDLGGAVAFLEGHDRVHGRGVGVTGYCMGGGLALVLACQEPDDIKACVPFYGLIPWPEAQPDWSRLRAPVQGHYAGRDGFFTVAAARSLEAELTDLGKSVELFVYPEAEHAFFNDARPEVFDEDAAHQSWVRTLSFLRAHLG